MAIKQLLSLYLYKYTGKELCEIAQNNSDPNNFKFSLPEYTFNTDTKNLTDSESYFQFFTNSDYLSEDQAEENYILFDVDHADYFLSEEMNNVGVYDFLEQLEQDRIYDFLKLLPITYHNEYESSSMSVNINIVISINYIMSYSYEYGIQEVDDVIYSLLGYLDINMNFVEWKV
jgi:hypothetical protein